MFTFSSTDLAVDLGTVNTCVYSRANRALVSEPSIVAFDRARTRVAAAGHDARELLGRMPGELLAVKPVRDGVIADPEAVTQMLDYVIRKTQVRAPWRRRRMVVGVPSDISPVERRAVHQTVLRVNAKEVHLVQEPVAAANGAGITVLEPRGNMVVDIGGGTTNIAVVSGGYVVYSRSERIAGSKMDEAITQYVRRHHRLAIGEQTAEQIKIAIGSALPLDETETLEVTGQSLATGGPEMAIVSDGQIRDALADIVRRIETVVVNSLGELPPELCRDVYDRGFVLTGGGSLLRNLGRRLRHATDLPVQQTEDPFSAVVRGAGQMLEDECLLRRLSAPAA